MLEEEVGTNNRDDRREAAVKRVKAMGDFKNHIAAYVIVPTLLVVIWAVSGGGYFFGRLGDTPGGAWGWRSTPGPSTSSDPSQKTRSAGRWTKAADVASPVAKVAHGADAGDLRPT